MPILDGFSATQRIRQDSRYANLPILAMSANVLKNDKDKVLSMGMNDFIMKPVDPKMLFMTLKYWLTDEHQPSPMMLGALSEKEQSALVFPRSHSPASNSPESSALSNWPKQLPELDITSGLAHVMGNGFLYLSLLEQFTLLLDEKMPMMRALLEAKDKRPELNAISHNIKGIALTMGASHLANIFKHIETCDAWEPIEGYYQQALEGIDVIKASIRELQGVSQNLANDELVDRLTNTTQGLTNICQELLPLLEVGDVRSLDYVKHLERLPDAMGMEKAIKLLKNMEFELTLRELKNHLHQCE